ncbi:unnamed protein product [Clonostachys rhizophaga]|uniref:Cytidyltransferase-like domain-containing protein n=1 Tax=Clonostachys rhizophaga TaxID=160324 RepID=A0A9N9VHD6_9HYPO|nr:unnamed protein product [Clonostachys rhizophaga]
MAPSIPKPSTQRPSLLLLCSPPSPPNRHSIHAAYHAPISEALARVPDAPYLTVVLAAPFVPLKWTYMQSLLAGLYSLVASITDADVRIVLVDHVRGRDYPPDRIAPFNDTTVPDLGTYAAQKHRYQYLLHPSTEGSYELLATYLRVVERYETVLQNQIIPLPGGLSLSTEYLVETTAPATEVTERYRGVCLGGTFDHLHPGHKLLLHASTLLLKLPRNDEPPATLIVGISGDALLKNKKFASELESWPYRASSVFSFLSTILSSPAPEVEDREYGDNEELHAKFCDERLDICFANIVDVFGPTITVEDVQAIALSGETRGGGTSINERRVEKGWNPLVVFEIDVLDATSDDSDAQEARKPDDFSAKISSTEIRKRRAELKLQRSDH